MNLTIKWEEPAVPANLRSSIEARVATAVNDADFLKCARGGVVVNFVPAIPINSALVATIIETKLGKLLGVVEFPTDGDSIDILPFMPSTNTRYP